jgi:hypothetical protein
MGCVEYWSIRLVKSTIDVSYKQGDGMLSLFDGAKLS